MWLSFQIYCHPEDFHTDLAAHLVAGGLVSEPFPVKLGIKQGCVFAPVIFNIYLAAVTLVSQRKPETTDRISIKYSLDGSVFDLCQTESSITTVFNLQYGGDDALSFLNAHGLHPRHHQ